MGVSGTFFKAVVQEVLIFGLETWVTTPHKRRSLVGLHNRVSQQIMVQKLRRRFESILEYLPLVEEMWEAGLEEVD